MVGIMVWDYGRSQKIITWQLLTSISLGDGQIQHFRILFRLVN